ncbi:MAG: MFS transporter [Legionella sp.]
MPHPIIWLILYIPFGALNGFIAVALTYLATENGLSITEGALIVGSQLLFNWLKWIWAPLVDITLSPKRWYLLAISGSALGVFTLSAISLGKETLNLFLVLIALATFINTIVGMSVEAMIASLTPVDQIGRVSAWFQSGNLGGIGLGGGLGLFLMQHLSQPWMSGAVIGALFLVCCLALIPLPHIKPYATKTTSVKAMKQVMSGFGTMIKQPMGMLTAILCLLPVATGTAQSTLTQAAVAKYWGAAIEHVELVQGLLSGVITMLGCFLGGWICNLIDAHRAYCSFGILLAIISMIMALSPNTVTMYVVWNMIYALAVGLSYAAFTSMVLLVVGTNPAATGYNVYASLTNFPIWWLGLLLGWVADKYGPRCMLVTEALLGLFGVMVFLTIYGKKQENSVVSVLK